MKILNFKSISVSALTLLTLMQLALASCMDRFPSKYALELPSLPEAWVSILGEPHWRVEWVSTNGQKQIADFPHKIVSGIEIEIPVTWVNAVTAYPYWNDFNIFPAAFKPAGAIFPFDARKNRLHLSWEAGYDSVFYWELAAAQKESHSPADFDWQRFRELFQSDVLSEAVLEDPWVVNWRNLAERTSESNFDRRRIVSEAAESKQIPVPAGLWYGTSPFAKPLFFADNEPPVFPVRPGINIWISEKGILRISGNTWVFSEIK
ncbi:MAG: hypothetical protein FWC12_10485 [Treponema sp.]|nr:hypothetical protein [Treponema sp.]